MGKNGILAYVIFGLVVIYNCDGLDAGKGDYLSLGDSLIGNQTITSTNGTFELGFFSPNGSNNWYLGIWFARVSDKMVVWVANRESPAKKRPGVLNLSNGGNLGLFDAEGTSLWSVNVSKKPSRAVLLDSGNFLMMSDDSKAETLWQSFDYPFDTWLPGMWFGGQQKLVCWKNSLDPAPGLYSFRVDPSGAIQLTWNNSVKYWESTLWNGESFSDIPDLQHEIQFHHRLSYKNTSTGVYFNYKVDSDGIPRFIQIKSGGIQPYVSLDGIKWTMVWNRPRDQCDAYGICGPYGSCNSNNLQFCTCVEGFTPADKRTWDSQEWWSSGCVRWSPLNCGAKNGSIDGFIDLSETLPDDSASSYPALTKKDCQEACLRNCSCTAFTFNSPSGSCQIWSGDLLNMQNPSSNNRSTVSIRVAASALPEFHKPPSSSKLKTVIIVSVLALALAFSIVSFLVLQRYRLREPAETSEDFSGSSLRMFSYKELKIATRNFRSKLGSGGFGTVFKGSLTDGTLVAVKKLNSSSRQHDKQFRAEISCLGNIQHANLIRLRGFCAKGSTQLLVYDYMPNGSLNSLLFTSNSTSEQKILDWKTRLKIALGTARGLAYLHEDCRDRIIHGDVKPENILLGVDFSPKLADFGLAKLVGRDFSDVLTTTRGTRGYLAPEWIYGLPITPKVDVYSFGMTLLEIISGRRNLDMSLQDSNKHYFPSWATAQIFQGNMIHILEEIVALVEEADMEEARRAIIIGLLCIATDENVRPSMGQVVRMLEGKMEP
ncbi:hypothetical protein SUGI_0543990 [Cryptomeria japonica]|uniref:G-type lectin S-receptor-like serine/threonine-protein kinase At2g19130 n=1 Tax=Cryptomeria japonica TaxID=3369 RepID=UPI002408A796|nr:G-type lectin S-receptor-like serine/threonine-protein kinase At2g19130 [Cryptomeria japonica]GLJ27719.1 hypothetical protein SUGI_0543990 [Cryptomeria japonica]